jgi:general secretion pathway protein K
MAVIVGARYRTRFATNYSSVAAAEVTAESAVNLAIATALTGPTEPRVNFPLRCRMPGGERVLVTIEEETGKIDLNTTSLPTLIRFFSALIRDQSLGARIAGRIVELRNPKTKDTNAGAANAPSGPHFASIMQLDQIDGISPRLFRASLRLVTVRSGRPEPDPDAASPALRQLLGLEQKPMSPARGLPAGGSVTIRADVRSPDGARFVREALVSLAAGGKPFLVHEWRHGDLDPTAVTASAVRGDTQDSDRGCFRTINAVAS